MQSKPTRIFNQHQKFHKAKYVIDQLPALASEVGMDEFMERLEVLEQLKDVWTRGRSAVVVEVPDHDEPCAEDLSGMLEQNKLIQLTRKTIRISGGTC